MHNALPIYEFLASASAAGKRAALVTITAVTGASSRSPGTHMAVCEDGSYAGSFSGGCIEAAVVAEARDAIGAGDVREVRFGAGSDYIDIRLPCGGSVDLLFNPLPDTAFITDIVETLRRRLPGSVRLPRGEGSPCKIAGGSDWQMMVRANTVELTYIPALRTAIFGHGATVEALHRLVTAYGALAEAFTPDETIVERLGTQGERAHLLNTPASPITAAMDPWTAAIFLFHDHDWEPHLLKAMLAEPCFFVGAMGSRITHAKRLQLLDELGVSHADREQIIAPIGLIPSSRDPETLALSILTQVVDAYHRRFMTQPE